MREGSRPLCAVAAGDDFIPSSPPTFGPRAALLVLCPARDGKLFPTTPDFTDHKLRLHAGFPRASGAPPSLNFKRELSCGSLWLPRPVTLVVSAHNPGAAALANELVSEFNAIEINAIGAATVLGKYEQN